MGDLLLVLILYPPASYMTSIFIYALPIIVITYFVVKTSANAGFKTLSNDEPKYIYTRNDRRLRNFLIVLLSKTLGNIWGGLLRFSRFIHGNLQHLLSYARERKHPDCRKNSFLPGDNRIYHLRLDCSGNVSIIRNLARHSFRLFGNFYMV